MYRIDAEKRRKSLSCHLWFVVAVPKEFVEFYCEFVYMLRYFILTYNKNNNWLRVILNFMYLFAPKNWTSPICLSIDVSSALVGHLANPFFWSSLAKWRRFKLFRCSNSSRTFSSGSLNTWLVENWFRSACRYVDPDARKNTIMKGRRWLFDGALLSYVVECWVVCVWNKLLDTKNIITRNNRIGMIAEVIK